MSTLVYHAPMNKSVKAVRAAKAKAVRARAEKVAAPIADALGKAVKARLYEVRRAGLRLLFEQYESMTAFADAIGESLNYTSRLVKLSKASRKNLGEGKARLIEQRLGLPPGWLDREDRGAPLKRAAPIWPFKFDRAIWDNLSHAEQRAVEAMVLTMISGIEAQRAAQAETG